MFKKENDVDGLIDWEFIKKIETPKKVTTLILYGIGIILDICAWRNRKYASLIIYIEIFITMVK